VLLSGNDNDTTETTTARKSTKLTFNPSTGALNTPISNITNQLIEDRVCEALSKDLKNNLLTLPKHFDVEIQYKNHNVAYSCSFYPGCKLLGSDRVIYSSDDYYEVLRMLKFIL
jgi:D-aminopeptidase